MRCVLSQRVRELTALHSQQVLVAATAQAQVTQSQQQPAVRTSQQQQQQQCLQICRWMVAAQLPQQQQR
jgi:hypothetical protein